MSSQEEGAAGGVRAIVATDAQLGEEEGVAQEAPRIVLKGPQKANKVYGDVPQSGIAIVTVVVIVSPPTFMLLQSLYALRTTPFGSQLANTIFERVRVGFARSSGPPFQGTSRPYLNGRGEQLVIPMLPDNITTGRKKTDTQDIVTWPVSYRDKLGKVKSASIPPSYSTKTRKDGTVVRTNRTVRIPATKQSTEDVQGRMDVVIRLNIGNADIPPGLEKIVDGIDSSNVRVTFAMSDEDSPLALSGTNLHIFVYNAKAITLTYLMQFVSPTYGAEIGERQKIGAFDTAKMQVPKLQGLLRPLDLEEPQDAFLPTVHGRDAGADFLENVVHELDEEEEVGVDSIVSVTGADLSGAVAADSPSSEDVVDYDPMQGKGEVDGDSSVEEDYPIGGGGRDNSTPEAAVPTGLGGSSGNQRPSQRPRTVPSDGGTILEGQFDAASTQEIWDKYNSILNADPTIARGIIKAVMGEDWHVVAGDYDEKQANPYGGAETGQYAELSGSNPFDPDTFNFDDPAPFDP